MDKIKKILKRKSKTCHNIAVSGGGKFTCSRCNGTVEFKGRDDLAISFCPCCGKPVVEK